MPKQWIPYNWGTQDQPNLFSHLKPMVYRRLLCVAFWEHVNYHVQVTAENELYIQKFLEIFFKDYPAVHVIPFVQWLLNPDNTPTRWERALLYKEMKMDSKFYLRKTHQQSSNINYFSGKREIKPQNVLSTDQMINVQVVLSNITYTIFDYKVFFKLIDWSEAIHEAND